MALQREFAQILQEKLGFTPELSMKTKPFPSQKVEFPSWKYQVFTNQRTFSPTEIPPAYPRKPAKKKTAPAAKKTPPQPDPTYKIGQLGLEFTSDLIALQTLGADLDPAQLSLDKLKKEYRKLAKNWHPDHNSNDNSGKNFQMATEAYGRLSQAIESQTTN